MNNRSIEQKVLAFEYMLSELFEWYSEIQTKNNSISDITSFSRLKSLKLLFLTAAVGTSEDNEGLLDIFNNFYAMQHGPVESDIYGAILAGNTHVFDFSGRDTKMNDEKKKLFNNIDSSIKQRIDSAIALLKEQNKNIVTYPPFDLVEITHKWNSWKIAIEVAQILGKGSEMMNIENIKSDVKYFS